jgi:microcystin-dependent protein
MEGYLGEIRMFSGSFAPEGWLPCDGRLVPRQGNQDLFAVLGQTFGGNGESFALPDLRGRSPIMPGMTNTGSKYHTLGEEGGEQEVQLTYPQMPAHSHEPMASNLPGNTPTPEGNFRAVYMPENNERVSLYRSPIATNIVAQATTSQVGKGQAHDNMQPYLCVNFIICVAGTYLPPP